MGVNDAGLTRHGWRGKQNPRMDSIILRPRIHTSCFVYFSWRVEPEQKRVAHIVWIIEKQRCPAADIQLLGIVKALYGHAP